MLLTRSPWETLRSPGRGVPAWRARAPRGSARWLRLGFGGSFGLGFGLRIKARGQKLVYRQLCQAPAGHDAQVTAPCQPGVSQPRCPRNTESPFACKHPLGGRNGPQISNSPLTTLRRRHDCQPAACAPLPAPECRALGVLPPVGRARRLALRFSNRGSGGF